MKLFDTALDSIETICTTIRPKAKVDTKILTTIERIVRDVAANGDSSLIRYAKKFDSLTAAAIRITDTDIRNAAIKATDREREIIDTAYRRIYDFHAKQSFVSQIASDSPDEILGTKVTPLHRVGIYVPGGKALYPSTILMDAIPAIVAGVKEIVMVSPMRDELFPIIGYAIEKCGIAEAYRIGGAHAVAALAYGTETIRRVDKIVGPGNVYVAYAKKLVFGDCDIDMIAGPSEVLIVADRTANPEFVIADMLSQAEHDEMAKVAVVSDSQDLLDTVGRNIVDPISASPRRDILKTAIENNCYLIKSKNLAESISLANDLAFEHLELLVADPLSHLPAIRNAGAIFLGEYSPEPLGDYVAGPNHTLPTDGGARFFSPLMVKDFVKFSTFTHFSKAGFIKVAQVASDFAGIEGLYEHKRSIDVRLAAIDQHAE